MLERTKGGRSCDFQLRGLGRHSAGGRHRAGEGTELVGGTALVVCDKAFVFTQDTMFLLFLIMRAHHIVKDF